MQQLDLNLLATLEALLSEGSVTGAAARLNKSVPATSRALGRLRVALSDPLFVRAGRGLTPTPRAMALGQGVRDLLAKAQGLLNPEVFDPKTLERTFVVRCGEDVALTLGSILARAVSSQAPGVTLRLAPEGDEDVAALRDGRVDMDIGSPGALGPEVMVSRLLVDRYVSAARAKAPIFAEDITPARFAEARHIAVSRRGLAKGPLDEALAKLGLTRRVALITPSASAALAVAQDCDLIATVPGFTARAAQARGLDLRLFDLPAPTPEFCLAICWHPRLRSDPGHAWLRGMVRAVAAGL